MLSKCYNRLCIIRARFAWSGFALMVLLQRGPVLKVLADAQFFVGPKLVHVVKWVAGAVLTSSTYNSVTGATGDLSIEPGPGSEVGKLNEYMVFAIAGFRASIKTYEIDGLLPQGVNANLANGVVSFSGIPVEVGEFSVRFSVLSWEGNPEYESGSIFVDVNVRVTLEGPDITVSPQSTVVVPGSTAQFVVEVAEEEGTTYQWQRNVDPDLAEFENVIGATESTFTIQGVMSSDQGAYRVRVTRNEQTVIAPTSPPAYVFLTLGAGSDYDTWKNENFTEFSFDETGPMENPDDDSLINAFEFLFDLDPEVPDTLQIPEVSRERIGTTDYAVFRFPALIDYPDLNFVFESTTDLQNGLWSNLENGVNGAVIEEFPDATILKIPYADNVFCRVKVEVE